MALGRSRTARARAIPPRNSCVPSVPLNAVRVPFSAAANVATGQKKGRAVARPLPLIRALEAFRQVDAADYVPTLAGVLDPVDGDHLVGGVTLVVEAGVAEHACVIGLILLVEPLLPFGHVAAVGLDGPADRGDQELGGVVGGHGVRAVIARVRVGLLEGIDRRLRSRDFFGRDGCHGAGHPDGRCGGIRFALVGDDTVTTEEGRSVGKAGRLHLVADHARVVAVCAAEIDRLRAGLLCRPQEWFEVADLGGVGEVLALDDRPAILLETDRERVGDALSVGLSVGRHTDFLDVQGLVGVVRHGRALVVVGGGDPEVIVRPGWAQILRERYAGRLAVDVSDAAQGLRDVDVLGQALVRVGWADLDEVGPVADRDLGARHARVERSDHAENLRVVDQLLDVLRALLRVVNAIDGIVKVRDGQGEALDGLGLVDREFDAVKGRDTVRGFAARLRQFDAYLDRSLV